MKKIAAILLLPLFLMAEDLSIGKYLNMIAEGKTDEVRSVMLDLYVEQPNDPGVMLLAGAVLQDAFKAMDFYQKIVQEHPKSEWADDAIWRIIQFYAILGDEKRANAALEIMRQKYPTSQFLIPATDVVRSAVGLARYQKENEMKLPKLDVSKNAEPLDNKGQYLASNETELGKDDEDILFEKNEVRKKTAQDLLREQMKASEDKSELNKPQKENSFEEIVSNDTEVTEIAETPENTPISYGLQVAAYESRDLAEQEQRKYLAQSMRTQVIPTTKDGKTQFSVVIGAYSSKRSAEAAKIIVSRQCSCDPIIIQK